LCGPILRKVEADAVTVWVALKEERKVWLEVYEDIAPSGSAPNLKKILEGNRKPIRAGQHLFLIAVTANLVAGEQPMAPGKIFFYNLFFTDINATSVSPTDTNLESPNVIHFEIHYAHEPEDLDPQHRHVHLPSFCLAPDDLNLLRIVHGSCRKIHAEGLDAMPAVDEMILADRFTPDQRPHYLLLTGDQFYADDISPIILYLLMDAEKSLIGEVEHLPQIGKPALPDASGNNGNFLAGQRKDKGGFTSGESNHIATAGEYFALYLFMWSDVVWDADLPDFDTVFKGVEKPSPVSVYLRDVESINKFKHTNYNVKRAMANVPTYMIFDDHDVTDDWYMTHEWCEKTLSDDLGRRMIMNGLMAYALFQSWGNTPELFFELDANGNKPNGKLLLEAVEAWFTPGSKRDNINASPGSEPDLQKFLGIPLNKANPMIKKQNTEFYVIDKDPAVLRWDYVISREKYEIKFLDGRTNRGYPDHAKAPRGKQAHPDIISEESMIQQFDHDDPTAPVKELTLVVVPTSLVSIPAIELDEFPWFVSFMANLKFNKEVYEFDVYDHWRNQSKAAEKFIALLAERNTSLTTSPGVKKESRVIILTGDVHFAAASRLEFENDDHKSLFAQVISSSFKKQDIKTRILHQRGYKFSNVSALSLGNAFVTKFPELLSQAPIIGPILIIGLIWPLVLLHIAFWMLDKLLQILDQTILKDWFEQKGMDSRHFLGWKDPAQENIQRLLIPVGLLDKEVKLGIPAVVESTILASAKDPKLKFPDWQYRIDFIYAANDVRQPAPYPTEDIVAPGPGDRKEALKRYLSLAKNHMSYARKWGNGKEIVGVNNVSEIFFNWSDSEKAIRQETWWRLEGTDGDLKLFPLSNFTVPLNFNDSTFPLPQLP
jgi:hypothetical protein